ncbi:glycosyl transferase group 1 [Flexistipes sinusarabici DSM 4947]|uniref:Glycosyl transferase group 1 n=2 Tax=Flexistipes sinusarabici TaxID=2352 RepID=F8E8J1_FLESM|nr:glycosyl transferase group 1 [Flexistipes sinusarabici DSM 4947]
MGKYIKESHIINNKFITKFIRLGTTNNFNERQRTTLHKIIRFAKLILRCFTTNFIFNPDLIYMSISSKGMGFYKDALIILILKVTGRKFIYHFHNKGVRTRQDKWLDNILYKIIFKNADVILLSQHLYTDIEKYVPENRVHYCSNGIPEISIENDRLRYDKEIVNILFFSNLIESKGVFVLLEACNILKEKQLLFRCIFAGVEGDITADNFYKRVNVLNLSDYVEYLGSKYGKDKEDLFLTIDIFAHPTFEDCSPLVLIEAMQYSLPIISTYEGGIPDIIEDRANGFLVNQLNSEAVADKLEFLIKNPEMRKKMGETGRQKYLEQFTLNKFEKQISNILEISIKK